MSGAVRLKRAWRHDQDVRPGRQTDHRLDPRPEGPRLVGGNSRYLGSEFGRTPTTENEDGRDHNPHGFTMWLAGGGMKPGLVYGRTDDYGYYSVENKVHFHDLHATILHLLGLDHKKLTYRYAGRDFRLTDVHGEVVRAVLA